MKKALSVCLLATSLLAVSQFAAAVDPVSKCKLFSDVKQLINKQQHLSVDKVSGLNRFDVSGYTYGEAPSYEYLSYKVTGVKGQGGAGEAIQNAFALLDATSDPTPTVMQDGMFYCVYPLTLSSDQTEEYNGINPVLKVQINDQESNDFYSFPQKLNIGK